jgi:hypothetical protein
MIHLTHIYNANLRIEYFPEQWKITQVIMLLKSDIPPEQVISYRLSFMYLQFIRKIIFKTLKTVDRRKTAYTETPVWFPKKILNYRPGTSRNKRDN